MLANVVAIFKPNPLGGVRGHCGPNGRKHVGQRKNWWSFSNGHWVTKGAYRGAKDSVNDFSRGAAKNLPQGRSPGTGGRNTVSAKFARGKKKKKKGIAREKRNESFFFFLFWKAQPKPGTPLKT